MDVDLTEQLKEANEKYERRVQEAAEAAAAATARREADVTPSSGEVRRWQRSGRYSRKVSNDSQNFSLRPGVIPCSQQVLGVEAREATALPHIALHHAGSSHNHTAFHSGSAMIPMPHAALHNQAAIHSRIAFHARSAVVSARQHSLSAQHIWFFVSYMSQSCCKPLAL